MLEKYDVKKEQYEIITKNRAMIETLDVYKRQVYASGFPKNQDISKQIDKKYNAKREIVGVSNRHNSRAFGEGNGDETYGAFKGGIPYITAPSTDSVSYTHLKYFNIAKNRIEESLDKVAS